MNIFVGGLPFKVDEKELREIFEKFGEASVVKIIMDKQSGRSKVLALLKWMMKKPLNKPLKH